MPARINSPLRYPGGKSKALKKILPMCYSYFSEYREPFLGGGSVFLALKQKYPNKDYYVNDINYNLYCFWSQLRDNPDKMINEIIDIKTNHKNGKKVYSYYYDVNKFQDEFLKAIRFYILNRITYSGTVDSGGYSQEAFDKRFTLSKINQLKAVSNLLQDVKITCDDYTNSLNKEGKNIFIYLDPPYYKNISSKLYGNKGDLHTSFNHKKFAHHVKSSKHYWLITLDDSNTIKKLFSFGYKYFWKMQYGMDNVNGNKPKKENELIITNYIKFKMLPVNYIPKKKNVRYFNNIIDNFLKNDHNYSILKTHYKNAYYVRNKLLSIINENGIKRLINVDIINNDVYLEKLNDY